jgi:hypothetical protein
LEEMGHKKDEIRKPLPSIKATVRYSQRCVMTESVETEKRRMMRKRICFFGIDPSREEKGNEIQTSQEEGRVNSNSQMTSATREWQIPPDKRALLVKVHNSVMGHNGASRMIKLLDKMEQN